MIEKPHTGILAAVTLAAFSLGCSTSMNTATPTQIPAPSGQSASTGATNTLLMAWTGAYGGVPAFDRVNVADFKPALETAMTETLAEVDRIANNTASPTFANTIEAMERSGESLDRVFTYYGIWSSNMNTPEFQPIQREMAPKLAAFNDQIN